MVYSVKKTAIDLTPNQRTELLPSLYGALASYIGEDFSAIIAACDKIEAFEMKQWVGRVCQYKGKQSSMSARQKIYEAILSEFKEKVCCNPDADFISDIRKDCGSVQKTEKR